MGGKITYEKEIVALMIGLYCRKRHGGQALCDDCRALQEYAATRLDRCPFGEGKPACSSCRVHCYKPDMRERICRVMRFSGPRMLIYHPRAFVKHYLKRM